MKQKFVTIDTSTLSGLKKAERLQAKGYKLFPGGYVVTYTGIDKIQFTIPAKTQTQ
jgi:hypothetical protein